MRIRADMGPVNQPSQRLIQDTAAFGRKVTGTEAFLQDCRQANDCLRGGDEGYHTTVRAVGNCVMFTLDMQGYIIRLNQEAQSIKGYDPEDVLGQRYCLPCSNEDIREGESLYESADSGADGARAVDCKIPEDSGCIL